MNIIESYALQCGAKISEPYINEAFFPLPFDKFITFQPWSKPSKNYDYWQDVIRLIYPYLNQEEISIVQIGGKEESILPGCYSIVGKTNFKQVANVIKRAKLHFGSDSFCQHIAGACDIPLVDLISNNYPNCVSPYFGDEDKHILISPKRKDGERPSFSIDEGADKQINRILPEDIAGAILNLLKIPHTFPYKTLKIGRFFNNIVFESVPNEVIDLKAFNNPSFYIRADLEFNLNVINTQLGVGPCNIVTSKPIPKEILIRHKERIPMIIYILWDGYDLDFIKTCTEMGIKLSLGSFKSPEWIKEQKLYLHQYGIISQYEKKNKENLDFLKDIDNSKLFFKSNKFLLSNKKFYQSKAHYLNNRPIGQLEPAAQSILDCEDFWFDFEHYYFLTK